MADYLLLFLIVLGIHLTPAFTPPTWPVIMLYSLSMRIPLPLLVLSAAVAAALGRYGLARVSSLLSHRLGNKARRNLDMACAALKERKRSRVLVLGLFLLSPLPSAQLFEAAGLARARLIGPTAAYFAGRLGFYSIYALGAHGIAATGVAEGFQDKLTSPLGIAVQLAVLVMLAALIRLDWSRWLARRTQR